MNVKEIKELVDLVARRGLSALEVERAGFRLRIEGPAHGIATGRRGGIVLESPLAESLAAVEPLAAIAGETSIPSSPSTAPSPAAGRPIEEALHLITSPIVGTFYRAPTPEAEPFVKVGDEVVKGKTLCIVEAMKLMNEIEADVAGVVLAVFPQNGQPIEFGEKLFAIQPR